MIYLFLNISLALFWTALTASFTPANLALGFILSYAVLFLLRRAIGPTTYFLKVKQLAGFIILFTRDLIISNLRVAADILTPKHYMQPRIIALPLDAKTDFEITVLANLISLTPGTLSLDVSSDRKILYIHVMYALDAQTVIYEIKQGLEKQILALMRGVTAAQPKETKP